MKNERKDILRKLMHTPLMTFNQLWAKEGESNNFAYHLKVLEEDGLVHKTSNGYSLTHEGKKQVAYVDGKTGEIGKAPLIGVIVATYDEKNKRFLMMRREKEPFFGYWCFASGKIKFDQYILECAKEELLEETGLTCDLELKGLYSAKTYSNKTLSFNHQLFVVKATNPKGKLIEKTREGTNMWVKEKDISKLNIIPNLNHTIDMVKSKKFGWVEEKRFQSGDKFKKSTILKNIKF